MAGTDVVFYYYDLLSMQNPAASIYSTNSLSYPSSSQHAIRYTDWNTCWLPATGAVDAWLIINGGSAGWAGTSGTMTVIACYDARGSEQQAFTIQEDGADSPTFAAASGRLDFVTTTTQRSATRGAPVISMGTFAITAGGKQYYRVMQSAAARSGGATKPLAIYSLSFFIGSGTLALTSQNAKFSHSPASEMVGSASSSMIATSGMVKSNWSGRPYQQFDLSVTGLRPSTRDSLLTVLQYQYGQGRNFFMTHHSIQNVDQPGLGMVRLDEGRATFTRKYHDQYDLVIPMRTLVQPL